MNELHLFAGAGGGILGGILLGHTCVCAVEIKPYCRKVLLQRQQDGILPKFPIWDDVRTFDGNPWRGLVDVLCGGFPCTDISQIRQNAKGLDGDSSRLWHEMRRVISEVGPRFVFVENSPMLTVRGLDRVLADLSELGFDARWGVIGARNVGAPHRRNRIWILGYTERAGLERFVRNGATAKGWTQQGRPDAQAGLPVLEGPWAEARLERGDDGTERYVQPGIFGVAPRMADCMDRLKAIGNGQVPIVAATAFRLLSSESMN